MKKILALTALTGALTFGTVTYTETKPNHVEADQAQAAVCNVQAWGDYYKTESHAYNGCGYAQAWIKKWRNGQILHFKDKSPNDKSWSHYYNYNYEPWSSGGYVW